MTKSYSLQMWLYLVVLVVAWPLAADQPKISLNRQEHIFAFLDPDSMKSSYGTPGQTFTITNSGSAPMSWQVIPQNKWIKATPVRGINSGTVTVTVDAGQLLPGWNAGTLRIEAPGAVNSPQTFHVSANLTQTDANAFGGIDNPGASTIFSGNITITGWALDDIGVQRVELYRYPQPQEGTEPVFLGNAAFQEGSRPDLQQQYSNYPLNYRAGWGFMLLTNFLPSKGIGMYTLFAQAVDQNNVPRKVGVSTITCDNGHAVKPFGAIDTPAPGGLASGAQYVNWGWVLTPSPNQIPAQGTTIDVLVDGVNVGHPTYNVYRQDIADLFPGYANSDGAAAFFALNTEVYQNGVHTIEWIATDNAGNKEGIGSRYFTIHNSADMATAQVDKSSLVFGKSSGQLRKVGVNQAIASVTPPQSILVKNAGGTSLNWRADATTAWIKLAPASGKGNDRIDVSVNPAGLATGVYTGTIVISDSTASMSPQTVMVSLNVLDRSEPPVGAVSRPVDGATVSGTIAVTGWALDDVGVDSVWLCLDQAGALTKWAQAYSVEDARPDISKTRFHYPNSDRAGWGCLLTTNLLPGGGNGAYRIVVVAKDVEGQETILGSRTIQVDNQHAQNPFGSVDVPVYGGTLSPDHNSISGWALTPSPKSIPTDGSGIRIYLDGEPVGRPQYNMFRKDIADRFPDLKNAQGAAWQFSVDVDKYAEGPHALVCEVTDDGANISRFQQYVVISHQQSTGVTRAASDVLPLKHRLFPAYPNPFNGATQIDFLLQDKADVKVVVYDLLGRQIQQLVGGFRDAGRYTVVWEGKDGSHRAAASGLYFVVLRAGQVQQTQKIFLLR